MSTTNSAAWLRSEKAGLTVEPAPYPTAGPHEAVIRNRAIGLIPVESKQQKLGIFPLAYPNVILGTSYAGIVEVAGESSQFKEGDRVVVLTDYGPPNASTWNPKFSSHQKFVLAKDAWISKLGDNTSFQDAAGTNVNLATVVGALSVAMGIEAPFSAQKADPTTDKKKILIYGGSSSVGGLAIQYAIQAGLSVVTTSSPRNKGTVQSLGPTSIVDHTATSDEIYKAIEAEGPYDYIFDTISFPPTIGLISKYLSSVGGGTIFTTQPLFVPQDIPANVQLKFSPYPTLLENTELGKWFSDVYLPQGLENGWFVPTKTEVVKGGLDALQSCMDRFAEGKVSGVKLVVDPFDTSA